MYIRMGMSRELGGRKVGKMSQILPMEDLLRVIKEMSPPYLSSTKNI